VGYDADADREINKLFTYNNTPLFEDRRSDAGTFSGDFIFTQNEMANLRQFYATQRGTAFSLTAISGVLYPFGKIRHTATGGYPYVVKILKIEDEKMWGVSHWICKITFVESFISLES
jgi:hypothetical protein